MNVRSKPTYPFTPRSNKFLEVGQFWPINLSNGQYAAGIVLGVPTAQNDPKLAGETTSLKHFIAGLLDWTSASAPTMENLPKATLLDWGTAHIRMIADYGQIMGKVEPPQNVLPMKSHTYGSFDRLLIYNNGVFDHVASKREIYELPTRSHYGSATLNALAEHIFVNGGVAWRAQGPDTSILHLIADGYFKVDPTWIKPKERDWLKNRAAS